MSGRDVSFHETPEQPEPERRSEYGVPEPARSGLPMAKFVVSNGLLKEMLHLPPLAHVVSVDHHDEHGFTVTVIDPALPAVDPADLPLLNPVVTKEQYRWDWNVQP